MSRKSRKIEAAPAAPAALEIEVAAVSHTVETGENFLLFGTKFGHNTLGVLHGDECALCGKRTVGGRGVKWIGYAMDTDQVMRPEDVAQYNAEGGAATLALIGEDCFYRNRDTFKRWTTTVRSKAGAELLLTFEGTEYAAMLATKKAPVAEVVVEAAAAA